MRILSFPLGSLILLAACGSDPKPVAQAPDPTPPLASAPAPQPEKPGDVPTRSNINISDDIRKACGIPDADAHFAYDSANVRPQDQAILQKLAQCFSTGPLKGKTMASIVAGKIVWQDGGFEGKLGQRWNAEPLTIPVERA